MFFSFSPLSNAASRRSRHETTHTGKPGDLAQVSSVDLLAHTLNSLVARAGLNDLSAVDDVIGGVVTPVRSQGGNVPRLAVLKAGWPAEIPALQISRMCASSLQAAHFGASAIASGDAEVIVACGVEMMGHERIGSDGMYPVWRSCLLLLTFSSLSLCRRCRSCLFAGCVTSP